MKKNNDKIKKILGDNTNSFVDKLASIKYITKKDSKLLSSVVSGVLKKKNNYLFITKKEHPWCQSLCSPTVSALESSLVVLISSLEIIFKPK